MRESINKQLDIPIATPESIDRQIVQQGLHTPDIGITDPTNDNPAYDSQFYKYAPVPDIAGQGVRDTTPKSFKAMQPDKSWYRPNTFAGSYGGKLTLDDIEKQSATYGTKSNMVDYVRDMRQAAGDSEEVGKMTSELNDTSTPIPIDEKPEPMPPMDMAEPKTENGMDKVLMLGGGILLLYVLYSVLKK